MEELDQCVFPLHILTVNFQKNSVFSSSTFSITTPVFVGQQLCSYPSRTRSIQVTVYGTNGLQFGGVTIHIFSSKLKYYSQFTQIFCCSDITLQSTSTTAQSSPTSASQSTPP